MKPQLSASRLLFPLLGSPRSARAISSPRRQSIVTTTTRSSINRLYPGAVRGKTELNALLSLSASSRQPLITLWTASYDTSTSDLIPLIHDVIENDGIAEIEKGLAFAEADADAPLTANFRLDYFINSTPTLLAFNRYEAQLQTKVTSLDLLKDREFLKLWLQEEAKRGGDNSPRSGIAFMGRIFGG